MTHAITPFEINEYTSRLFVSHMLKNEQAITYLRERGMDGPTAKRYLIGYAPRSTAGHSLAGHLEQSEPHAMAAIEAGLIVHNEEGRARDRFSDRIMFPIRDTTGRIIGFGGRILQKRNDNDTRPKYLNTQETVVFKKRNNLYGLYEALEANGRTGIDDLIIVEGYMDVVMLARHGITNAVASLGTAITSEQIKLAFQYTSHIVFCFDGDRAGVGAALKALSVSAPWVGPDKSVSFVFLTDGEDPDSLVRAKGALLTRWIFKSTSMTFSEFLIDSARYSQPDPDCTDAASVARQYIAGLPVLTRLFSNDTRLPADHERDVYRACILAEYNQAMGVPTEFIHPSIRPLLSQSTQDRLHQSGQTREIKRGDRNDEPQNGRYSPNYPSKRGRGLMAPPVLAGSRAPNRIQVARYLADQHDGLIDEAMNHASWPQGLNLTDLPEWEGDGNSINDAGFPITRNDAVEALIDIAIKIHSDKESEHAKSRALSSIR